MVISSLLIKSDCDSPEVLAAVMNAIEGVEVTETREKNFAIVLETESTQEAVAITARLEALPGVVNLQLVSHFFEDEADGH